MEEWKFGIMETWKMETLKNGYLEKWKFVKIEIKFVKIKIRKNGYLEKWKFVKMEIQKNWKFGKIKFKELRTIEGNRKNKEIWINEIGNNSRNFNHSKIFLNI